MERPRATRGTAASPPRTSRTRRSPSPGSLATPRPGWRRAAGGSSLTSTMSSPGRERWRREARAAWLASTSPSLATAVSRSCWQPQPGDRARALGVWSRSSVWEILRNPKYTGYQVWNRRARKTAGNRDNPPEAWIWSEESAHPAVVSKEEFEAVAARAAANRGSRQGAAPTTHQYLYRGILRCGLCGLRMWGNHRRSSAYYSCQPSHQRSANIPAGHPAHVYLGEPALHEAVVGFLSTALFGPERHTYWRRRLADCESKQPAAPVGERPKEVTTEVADLDRKSTRLNS